jgi:hypothetical protein
MGSFAQGALIEQKTTTTTAGSTTNLSVGSTTLQRFSGSLAQTVILPDATTLLLGRYFIFENDSDANITINFFGGIFACYLASGTQRRITLYGNGISKGDWVLGSQVDLDGPLALHATRPSSNTLINITGNQVYSSNNNLLSISPIDDVLNVYPDTTINFNIGLATGGTTGGTVLTQGGVFTRPSVTNDYYVRLIFTYLSTLNSINTKFSTPSSTSSGLENPGILFASIDGVPLGYVDLKAVGTGSFNFKSATSSSTTIENKDIVRFAAGTGVGGAGDKSFRFQSINSNVLTVKAGFLILNDGRELYTPTDFTIDLTTISSVDGNYYGYIDTASIIPNSSTLVNGRKAYQITATNFYFSTTTPDLVNLSRFIPIGSVQRSGGTWVNQQTTALRRHDNIVMGVDSSLEFSQDYRIIGNIGDVDQIRAGHVLDINSFPSAISTANISWYNLVNVNDSSTNGRNLTANGAPVFTGTGILGSADCFAPDGLNDYLSSTSSFFGPNAVTDFSFGLWLKADNYSAASLQGLVSNWGAGNKSWKLQLNSGVLEFLTSSNGTLETTTFLFDATTLSGWNHLVVSYVASETKFYFYLNSNFLLSASLAIYSGTTSFNLAAAGGIYWFAGTIDEFFFISGNYLIQEEVNKIYSTKIVHNRSLLPTNQKWLGFAKSGDLEIDLNTNFTVDITSNILYADFSAIASTAYIAIKMHNAGTLGISKPVKARTLNLTASQLDALMPITHYLYDVPYLKLQVDEGSSQYATHDDSSYFKANTTQIISTGTSLASVLGSSTLVRFTYSVGGESINTRLLGRYIIVGDQPDCDFTDIWTALTAASTIAGSRILVISNQTLSTAKTISNNDVYVEFLPGIQIVSTVSTGTALTISGRLTTYNMSIDFQGNADGVSLLGSLSAHNNLNLKVSGVVTNAITFGIASAANRINGQIQVIGTLTTIVNDISTAQSNMWSISNGSRVHTELVTKIGSMRTTDGFARISSPTQTIRTSGTEILDCSLQHIFYKQGGTATITLSNIVEGQTINLILKSSGSAYTITWSPTIIWGPVGIPTPTAVANKYDFYTFIKVGNLIFGAVILSMA